MASPQLLLKIATFQTQRCVWKVGNVAKFKYKRWRSIEDYKQIKKQPKQKTLWYNVPIIKQHRQLTNSLLQISASWLPPLSLTTYKPMCMRSSQRFQRLSSANSCSRIWKRTPSRPTTLSLSLTIFATPHTSTDT